MKGLIKMIKKENTGYYNTGDYNTGNYNTGDGNTGNHNTGSNNTGYRNTGDWNTGDWNTGRNNTGNCNTGYSNTGYRNTGDYNTGDRNTGNCNTGYSNTGDWNTGHNNTGDCNTGYWNTGNRNTGDWNTGNLNTGYCNTITPDECFIFNKKGSRREWEECDKPQWMYDILLTEWVIEDNMSDEEKEAHPSYTTTGGYLKVKTFKQAALEAWEKADEDDRAKTFNLPNFDIYVFEEIFGFRPTKQKSVMYKGVEITEEDLKQIKELLK